VEEQEFNRKYWFNTMQIITVVNPTPKDYIFQAVIDAGVDVATGRMRAEQRQYKVPAGGTERFPGPIANMYLDQMAKLLAQQDEKFTLMIDLAHKAEYYDKLIVDMDDLMQSYQSLPQYQTETGAEETKAPEVPFAGVNHDSSPGAQSGPSQAKAGPDKVAK
jgi:hypothetical protein